MAIPASLGGWGGGFVKRTGIQVAMYPSTVRGVPIELQQSTGATTASSKWSSVFFPGTTRGPLWYISDLPLSTKRYYFRARHVGGGYSAGAFTPIVNARPVVIPNYSPWLSLNAVGNIEAPGAHVFLTSANTVKTGSQNTTSYLTKTLRIPYASLLPRNDATVWNSSAGWIGTTGAATNSTFFANAPIPNGVTVTKVSLRTWGNGAPDSIAVRLLRVGSTGSAVSLSTAIMTGGHGWVNTTLGTTELVTSTKSYVLEVVTAGNNKFAWYDITYRRPAFDRVY